MTVGVEDTEVGRAKVPAADHSSLSSINPPNFFSLSREMARAVGNKRTAVQKKSNAIGFSKRLARKKTRQSTSVDDVYEFKAEKVRRSKVALRLTKEELAELGRDNASDSEGDSRRNGQPQPRLIGQNSDDEGVDSEDDEDIDSDAAFGGSDEETFAGYGFIRKVR
jgi:U3 small nucleolar RNA-associated protein 14